MTEKEFLVEFVRHLESECYAEFTDIEEDINNFIPKFLEQHHKEYYEVEFVRIDETIKEQLVREFGFDPNEIEEMDNEEDDILAEQHRDYNNMISQSLRRRE